LCGSIFSAPEITAGLIDAKIVGDSRVDELAELELNPKPRAGICNFYCIPGPWIGENAVPGCVIAD
jgi:hypothetical protein